MGTQAAAASASRVRARVRVQGTVQGVGFRPFVYRLARELRLGGFVFNDAHGVVAEVEGTEAAVDAFVARLTPEAPPLAVVEEMACQARPPSGEAVFAIRDSPRGGAPDAPVTPDTAVCADCLRELRDPADRRFRYPFINCTNCGPRFTIVRGVPYDRPMTTMTAIPLWHRRHQSPADPASEYEVSRYDQETPPDYREPPIASDYRGSHACTQQHRAARIARHGHPPRGQRLGCR